MSSEVVSAAAPSGTPVPQSDAAAAPVEVAPSATPQETPAVKKTEELEDGAWASKFAVLSRREKKLLEERAQLKADREEVENYRKLKESKDPKEKLKHFGLTLEEVLSAHIEPGDIPSTPESEIAKIRKELEDIKKEKQEKEEAATRQ